MNDSDCMNCGWPADQHRHDHCPGGDTDERFTPFPPGGFRRYPFTLTGWRAWRSRQAVLNARMRHVAARCGAWSADGDAAFAAAETHANRRPSLVKWSRD